MDLFLKSSYTELQQAMAAPPTDRKAWATIYQKAIRLAEMQNLLFFRDRDEVKDPRWAEHCAAGRQAAADLANAALFGLRNITKADFAVLRQKHLALVDACNACHKTFARDAPTVDRPRQIHRDGDLSRRSTGRQRFRPSQNGGHADAALPERVLAVKKG